MNEMEVIRRDDSALVEGGGSESRHTAQECRANCLHTAIVYATGEGCWIKARAVHDPRSGCARFQQERQARLGDKVSHNRNPK